MFFKCLVKSPLKERRILCFDVHQMCSGLGKREKRMHIKNYTNKIFIIKMWFNKCRKIGFPCNFSRGKQITDGRFITLASFFFGRGKGNKTERARHTDLTTKWWKCRVNHVMFIHNFLRVLCPLLIFGLHRAQKYLAANKRLALSHRGHILNMESFSRSFFLFSLTQCPRTQKGRDKNERGTSV